MLNHQLLLLIERFVRGQLNPNEYADFINRLENDPELKQRTIAEKLVQLTLAPNPITQAEKIVEILGEDLFADEETTVTEKPEAENSYSLDELLQLFLPVPHLEAELLSRSAAGQNPNSLQQIVLLPENNVDCPENELFFAFDQPLTTSVWVSVLDNRETEIPLENNNIPAGATAFVVSLPANLPPGKYYWQLTPGTNDRNLRRTLGMAVGSFYKHANLKPNLGNG